MNTLSLSDIDLDFYKLCNETFVYGSQESKNELLEEFIYSIPELESEVETLKLEVDILHENSVKMKNLLSEMIEQIENSNSKLSKSLKFIIEKSGYET